MSKEHEKYDLNANIQEVLSAIDNPEPGFDGEEELETIHVYPVEGGGILFTRAPIEEDLDTSPLPTKPPTTNIGAGALIFGLFVILSCIMFQFYVLFNPYTVTVTLVSHEKPLTLTGTLQLGRALNPITLSQSAITPATGRGHQDAKQATGFITFYNGSNALQTIIAGTLLTGNDGVQVATDQTIIVPQANLPQIGEATVSAHALNTGSQGNIQTFDISIALSSFLTAKNLTSFMGGQDERDYQFVTKSDIDNAALTLKTTISESMQGALEVQLKTNDNLASPSCTTNIVTDHKAGDEVTEVKVTVSETCSGIAYNTNILQSKVTDLLNTQVGKKLGSGYSILGNPQITVTGTTIAKQVMLSFTSVSTWVYALTEPEQNHIKNIIAGKTKDMALLLLLPLPGVRSVSIESTGFGDDTRIPKNKANIHLILIYA